MPGYNRGARGRRDRQKAKRRRWWLSPPPSFAKPGLPKAACRSAPKLNEVDPATIYGGGAKG